MTALSYAGVVADGAPVRIRVGAVRLAACRKARGLTQRDLARLVGVSQNYIPALEAGSREPGPKLRGRLMESLGAGFFDLFAVVLVGGDGQELELRPTGPGSVRVSTIAGRHHGSPEGAAGWRPGRGR